MADLVEVEYEPKKHVNFRQGALVAADKTLSPGYGFLTYPMPPSGAFDRIDKKLMELLNSEMIEHSASGPAKREGSAKTKRKHRDKAIRRAVLAYLAQ